ncbi:Por secretion system C-terminal sorting domain-containing protein [Bizionia echini]|uniref:Por secretion system C-terminal sorting domain-containing protein n=1 Tax=Bizionia echini TaxID=649333 RepID=A0A1I5C205_9FLAO|nr:T9SS type A sorting domain-containing protein [Bizionia echini]SFN81080.1 Por secretion system C-terminal sorting domain-containing protein [Bizionia echini]
MKKITFLSALLCVTFSYAQSFTENFDVDTGVTTTLTKTLQGVSFTFTFTSDGDGGDFAWENVYGLGNSASINVLSGAENFGTTEKVTIKRTDGNEFTFSSIFINSTDAATVFVGGYVADVLVGSTQTVATGIEATLTFGDIQVDEVRLTSTDFYNINIDAFTGNLNTLSLDSYALAENKVFISPNPVNNQLQVSGLPSAEQYVIYNSLGQVVQRGGFINVQSILVETLQTGVYFLQADNNQAIRFIKL